MARMLNKNQLEKRGGDAEAPQFNPLLNTLQAADRLGISKRTMQMLMAERKIPYLKIGRSVRIRPEDLESFIQGRLMREQGWKGGRR